MKGDSKKQYFFRTLSELAQYVRIAPDCGIAFEIDRDLIASRYRKIVAENLNSKDNVKQLPDMAFFALLFDGMIDAEKLMKSNKAQRIMKVPELYKIVQNTYQEQSRIWT